MTWWRDTFHPGTVPLRKMVSWRVLRHVCSYFFRYSIFFSETSSNWTHHPGKVEKSGKRNAGNPWSFSSIQTYRSTIEKLTYWVQENGGGRELNGSFTRQLKGGCLKSMIPAREETWDLGGRYYLGLLKGWSFLRMEGRVCGFQCDIRLLYIP